MRNVLLALSILFVITLVPVYAADATPSSKSDIMQDRKAAVLDQLQQKKDTLQQRITDRKAKIQNRIETQKDTMSSRAAEVRRRLAERRKAIIRRHFARMYRRFQAAVTRLEKLAGRIESRLDKMEDRGIDVVSLRIDLASAEEDLGVAKSLLESLEVKVEDALASDDPTAEFETIKSTFREVRDLLKSVHQQFIAIVRVMKVSSSPSTEATDSATP